MNVAVVGSGPAGLMAATVAARAGCRVTVFEKRKSPGRKLLIAGASGLNITYNAEPAEFLAAYGAAAPQLAPALEAFPPEAWRRFITEDLQTEIYLGTSRRWFIRDMKAAQFLQNWRTLLERLGVSFRLGHSCIKFDARNHHVTLTLDNGTLETFHRACFALGGGSWDDTDIPTWPRLFETQGIRVIAPRPANAGYHVSPWPTVLVTEADRQPLKNVALTTSRGTKQGDLLITNYGLEGTPLYWLGTSGPATLDLLPPFTAAQITQRLEASKENLAPLRRAQKLLPLSPAAQALLFHTLDDADKQDLATLATRIKALPLQLTDPRPLSEAISAAGGLSWDEVDTNLQIKKAPGAFAAGEMLDWDAPTGGFLIQASVSTGYLAGLALTKTPTE